MIANWRGIATATLSVFALSQGWAQAPNCHEIESATFVDVYSGGNTTTGKITQGGILNGNTQTIYNSGAFPTPVSTTVSYSGDFTLTTNQGQLRALNVFLYDSATGFFTVLARINPNLSNGRFAGATGVLYINGKTVGTAIPITYPASLSGRICLANQGGQGGDGND